MFNAVRASAGVNPAQSRGSRRGAAGMVTTLPPLRVMKRVPVAALQTQVRDVRPGRLGHAQAVEREQGDQRVLGDS
jgi:hypothetical protein